MANTTLKKSTGWMRADAVRIVKGRGGKPDQVLIRRKRVKANTGASAKKKKKKKPAAKKKGRPKSRARPKKKGSRKGKR